MLAVIVLTDFWGQWGTTNANTIYANGDIISMDETQPTPEAIAVRGGLITAVGTLRSVQKQVGKKYNFHDLKGQVLLPGFIDAHGHLTYSNQLQLYTNLAPPPVGQVASMADLVGALKAYADEYKDAPWVIGFGYDPSLLAERRHPTKYDLDKISTTRPVVAIHVSGHLRACNSLCLELAGINENSIDPAGGIIRRLQGLQEPDGVLEETAMDLLNAIAPRPNIEQQVSLLHQTQLNYARFGVTTIQEGAASPENLKILQQAARNDLLFLDVVAFPHMVLGIEGLKQYPVSGQYENNFRIGGIKLSLDGSPQGKTAWLSKPYHMAPHGQSATYQGYGTLTDEQTQTFVDYAYQSGAQILAHANGDAAADQMIGAIKTANERFGKSDRRPVMIHAQTVREDQIVDMVGAGIMPSYFVAHTFFWGDWHRDSVLGKRRAARISPLRSSTDQGLKYTIHNDAPVVPVDMMRLLWTAVNRVTRSGNTLGTDQKSSVMEGLRAITIDAAYQYFEEDTKGSLRVGKRADLVILDKNPMRVDPMTIKDIKILNTIKDGNMIYSVNSD